jgi:hypothetical protein
MKILLLLILLFPATILAVPTLSLSAPSAGFVDDVVLIDARASTGVYNRLQANKTMSFTMDFGDGTPLVHVMAAGHIYRRAGIYTIRINGKDSVGGAATEVTHNITITEIPAATVGNFTNLSNTGNVVTNATNLQAAIDSYSTTNTIEKEIILADDFDAKGTIILKPTTGNKFITIKSASLASIPRLRRIDPEGSNLSWMPMIFAPNSSGPTNPAIGTPNPATTSVVKYYRFQGIRFSREDHEEDQQALIYTGQDGYNGNTSLATMNHHFIFDRCWFDGGDKNAAYCQSGLRNHANYLTVVDSWFAYFRLIGAGVDAEAMGIGISQGPNAVVNNHLVGGSEGFNNGGTTDRRRATLSSTTTTSATLSDGHLYHPDGSDLGASPTPVFNLSKGDPIALPSTSCANGGPYCVNMVTIVTSITGNNITFEAVPHVPTSGGEASWSSTPSFLEFRYNSITKPSEWRPFLADGTTPNPIFNGDDTQIKNQWEAKACIDCVVDSNYIYNTWHDQQPYALTLTVRNATGNESPTAAIMRFQWSNNILINAQNGMNISGSDDGFQQDKVSLSTRDIYFLNNLHINAGFEWDNAGPKDLMRLGEANPGNLKRVFVLHNTFDGSNGSIVNFGASNSPCLECDWSNNVHQFNQGGFMDSFGTPSRFQVENIITYFPPGDATTWTKNLVINRAFSAFYGAYAPMPATSINLGGVEADFSPNVDTVSYSAQFVSYATNNFTLVAGSPGKAAATDGTDVGINHLALSKARSALLGNFGNVICSWATNPACN